MKSLFPRAMRRFVLLLSIAEHFFEIKSGETFVAAEGSGFEGQLSLATYGLDVSFPATKYSVSTNYPWLPHNVDPENHPKPEELKDIPLQPLGNRQKLYTDLIEGCRQYYEKESDWCDYTEYDRVEMAKRQPPSMQNYTDLGFKLTRTPDSVFSLIENHWKLNYKMQSSEVWTKGNSYINHWDQPTYMVSIDDSRLRGGAGFGLRQQIWDAVKPVLEEWTGHDLVETSLYGIRVYKEGAVMMPHVDRLPLVASCIINVAQDVDEDWPIELYGHDEKIYNVTMKPGDMLLFESHSIIHSRPFPMKGRYYANVFIHFEPLGHTERHNNNAIGDETLQQVSRKRKSKSKGVSEKLGAKNKVHAAGHENNNSEYLPEYILENSLESKKWLRDHPKGAPIHQPHMTSKRDRAHEAAFVGDLKTLQDILAEEQQEKAQSNESTVLDSTETSKATSKVTPSRLLAEDEKGWQPLHESAKTGANARVTEFLVKQGKNDVNSRTEGGRGATALWIALKEHGRHHPVVQTLKRLGALSIGPEL